MVSAGLDTVPGNLIMGIAYLSSAHGQEIQKRAYDEIMKVYPDGDAWTKCLVEEKVPYVTALVREVLRFFTVIPVCLPRVSIKDIKYENAVIPAGTTFYMVHIHQSMLVNRLTILECLGRRLRRVSLQGRMYIRR
jgi:phenylacetate 2-hydroxylase